MRVVNESSVSSAIIINLFLEVGALNIGPALPDLPHLFLRPCNSLAVRYETVITHAQHANTTEVLVSKTVISFRVTATNFSVIMIS